MRQMCNAPRRILAAVALAMIGQMGLADPLHKGGGEGAYRHEDSGWVFPKQIGAFARVGAPYTIDGNNDVGAEYEKAMDDVRATAVVEVYSSDSAAEHAKLTTSKAAVESKSGPSGRVQSEDPFVIENKPELAGVRVTYTTDPEVKGSRTSLYLLRTEQWIVNIRTTTDGVDASKLFDDFVRDLRWETLGVDPGDLHRAGP